MKRLWNRNFTIIVDLFLFSLTYVTIVNSSLAATSSNVAAPAMAMIYVIDVGFRSVECVCMHVWSSYIAEYGSTGYDCQS